MYRARRFETAFCRSANLSRESWLLQTHAPDTVKNEPLNREAPPNYETLRVRNDSSHRYVVGAEQLLHDLAPSVPPTGGHLDTTWMSPPVLWGPEIAEITGNHVCLPAVQASESRGAMQEHASCTHLSEQVAV